MRSIAVDESPLVISRKFLGPAEPAVCKELLKVRPSTRLDEMQGLPNKTTRWLDLPGQYCIVCTVGQYNQSRQDLI